MLSSKQKLTLNIIAISIFAIIAILVLIILLQKDYAYKLDYDKVTFYSDNNIYDDLKVLSDANLILIAFDNAQNAHVASLIQYVQVFTIFKKQPNFYMMDEECIFYESSTRNYKTIKKEECNVFLKNITYPKIIIGNVNKDLEKTTIYINNNEYKIVSSSESTFNEYANFLEILYPNYLEELKGLEDFTSNITNKIN